jgi:hypothetical protein
VDGAGDSKPTEPEDGFSKKKKSIDPKTKLQPPKEHGHPAGMKGMEHKHKHHGKEAEKLAEDTITKGGSSWFGMFGGGDQSGGSKEGEKGKGKVK